MKKMAPIFIFSSIQIREIKLNMLIDELFCFHYEADCFILFCGFFFRLHEKENAVFCLEFVEENAVFCNYPFGHWSLQIFIQEIFSLQPFFIYFFMVFLGLIEGRVSEGIDWWWLEIFS